MDTIPRLSAVEAEILRLLIAHRELYGLELVTASDIIKRGTVYVTLGRMVDKGLVESHAVKPAHEPGLPRRLYRVTGLGQQAYRLAQLANTFLQTVSA
jgi:DNA-binding PadR family transcriptional regulator